MPGHLITNIVKVTTTASSRIIDTMQNSYCACVRRYVFHTNSLDHRLADKPFFPFTNNPRLSFLPFLSVYKETYNKV